MKKIITLISAIFATNVYADVKNFEGFTIELGAGYQKTDFDGTNGVEIDGVAQSHLSTNSQNESDDFYTIGATYSRALSDDYLMGVGFEYSMTDIDAGNPTLSNSTTGISTETTDFELKDMFAVYVKPQFVISDKQLAYAKLGYVHSELDYSDYDSEYISTRDTDLDGYILGVGYRHDFEKKLYGFVEANYINFRDDKVGGNYTDGNSIYTRC
jgi:hypothetical protein